MSDKQERKIGPEDVMHAYRLARNLALTKHQQLLSELQIDGYTKEEAREVVRQLAHMLVKHHDM